MSSIYYKQNITVLVIHVPVKLAVSDFLRD